MWTDSPAGLLIKPLLGTSAAGNVTATTDPVTGGIKELTVAGSTLASFVTLPGDEVAGVTAEV